MLLTIFDAIEFLIRSRFDLWWIQLLSASQVAGNSCLVVITVTHYDLFNDSSVREPQADQLINQVKNQSPQQLMTTKALEMNTVMVTKEMETEEAMVVRSKDLPCLTLVRLRSYIFLFINLFFFITALSKYRDHPVAKDHVPEIEKGLVALSLIFGHSEVGVPQSRYNISK